MNKKVWIILVAFALPFGAQAQLAKLMSKYHEKNCVTVTQLDKNLYGLYKKQNLPPEAEEALQNLDAVNILNLDLNSCDPDMENKVAAQFKAVLDSPNKYQLIKSHTDVSGKQLIYSQNKNGKITSMVMWNQSPTRLDIIELCGNIQPEQIASLPNILNIKGLNSLASLSPNNSASERYWQKQKAMKQQMETMKQEMNKQFNRFPNGIDSVNFDKFKEKFETMKLQMNKQGNLFPDDIFSGMDTMDFDKFTEKFRNNFNLPDFSKFPGMSGHAFGDMFRNFESMFDVGRFNFPGNLDSTLFNIPGSSLSSSSIQITNSDGKTKIKINSNNSDIRYVIDGQESPKGEIQMPENIRNVQVVRSKDDFRKSYLLITSGKKLGTFTSYKNGILTFQYDGQEYKYNLEKVNEPILVIDGEQTGVLSVDPSTILQIRPQSKLEKEIGYFPTAEVIINTK